MFRWYRNAAKCYVYLSDVSAPIGKDKDQSQCPWELEFRNSRWFNRGWTLQELLAPSSVEFFSREGEFLGDKKILERQIHEITGIPRSALQGFPLSGFSVSERMRWTANRKTLKKEDKAYCLLGIFDVSMSLRYGEGEKAFDRLESKVNRSSKYKDVVTWLAPTRPEDTQARVSALRHPGSGISFTTGPLLSWLQGESYLNSLMWITGKWHASSSSSFAVDKIKTFVSDTPGVLLAYHYCDFSDPDSQPLVNIVGSLAVQVSAWQPGILEDLKGYYDGGKETYSGPAWVDEDK
ncbi:hypothetical protein PV10_08717 [Exophiala mesophila]|uniref:Nephrocystin 3-like N-terminal domain-containing protein n=1 Tax=Exophiala mesophila TaxID=212818 RepID=A0A0D1Z2X8_EXOME|nr:uncharacterized protein PV10_08717 [Exophiala mesophila]KIV89117.1 hypothetical protein PV10_08717 [Exophiala mesophila]